MLIRHNVRTGSRQPNHMAHDTEMRDTKGCYQGGNPTLTFTSESKKCECGGWGELVEIEPLPRSEYRPGSVVPERYRVATPSVTTADGRVIETDEVDPAPVVEPAPSVPTTGDPMEAIRTLFGSLVPDAAKIAADIESASAEVRADIIADVERRIGELLVPNRIEVSVNGADPTKVKGTVNPVFAEVLSWLASGCNVYLVGPAGCGKTTLARQVADALGVTFYTTGQVLSEHQVTGFVDAGGNYHTTPFRQAFEYGGVWLADEMDGWSPEATLAANAALANGHATFPDSPESIKAHPQFMVIAAANTWGHGADREYVGRNEMDAATLDRFVMVPMDYDRALESEIAGQYREWLELVWRVRSTAAAHRVQMMSGTRAVVKGVKGLAAGLPMDLVTRRVLKGDLDDATWSKVSA